MYSITLENIQQIVARVVNNTSTIINHEIKPFSTTRYGIMGNHYILTVELEEKTLRFFVKTPPDSTILQNLQDDNCIEEIHFFAEVQPLLLQSYEGEIYAPACYLSTNEVLVFEDLSAQGYAIRKDSFYDEDSLKSALDTLAHFHSRSLVAQERLAKEFNLIFKDAFREKLFTDCGKGAKSIKLAFETLVMLAEDFGLDGKPLIRILKRIQELVKPIKGGCNVICHGDLWRSNIMFNDNVHPPKCVLVDYQMLRYASPTVDVAMLIHIHTTSEFRKESEYRMFQYYYKVLSDSSDHTRIPDYQTLLNDYEKRRVIGMAYSSTRWPPGVMAHRDDLEALEKWYLHNRIDIYRVEMSQNLDYKMKIKGFLEELINEGNKIFNSEEDKS